MRLLHVVDSWNRGGISAQVALMGEHSHHKIDTWGYSGSATPELEALGIHNWEGGPPETEHYDVVIGNTVGGWSHRDLARWTHERGSRFVELMHSIHGSPTPSGDVDGFVAMSDRALDLNRHMPNTARIYGICDVSKFGIEHGNAIGRLSRLVDEKRPQDFLDVAYCYPKEEFLMAGDGGLFAELRSRLSSNVTMLGWVTDHPAFYSRLKMFLFPTRDECSCMSVAAAQAASLPVICQDIPALRETTGGHAVFANGLRDFIQKTGEFIRDPSAYRDMGVASREWAMANFDVSVTVTAWNQYLEAL